MSVNLLEESSYFQLILEKGALRQSRKLLLRLGRDRLGEPDAATAARVEAFENLDELERLCERVTLIGGWQELFDSP